MSDCEACKKKAEEIENLQKKLADVKKMAGRRIHTLELEMAQKNIQLDALGRVWCDGGCESGVFRYHKDQELTEEKIEFVERNTERLRRWHGNHLYRKTRQVQPVAKKSLWERLINFF